jgi:hypothetical protein
VLWPLGTLERWARALESGDRRKLPREYRDVLLALLGRSLPPPDGNQDGAEETAK